MRSSTSRESSSGARVIQRKIGKICKLIRERPEIQVIYDKLDELEADESESEKNVKMMDCLIDEECITKYEDNVNAFIEDVETFFSAFTSLHGEVKECRIIRNVFYDTIREQFADVSQFNIDELLNSNITRKRQRHGQRQSQNEKTEPMEVEVDEVNERKSYNNKSDRDNNSDSDSDSGSNRGSSSRGRGRGRGSRRESGGRVGGRGGRVSIQRLSNTISYDKVMEEADKNDKDDNTALLLSVVNKMKRSRHAKLFLFPVDVSAAPGYTDIVKKPMDLHTIEQNIHNGMYRGDAGSGGGDISALSKDMALIWNNCLQYNDPDSDIAHSALELEILFERLCEDSSVDNDDGEKKVTGQKRGRPVGSSNIRSKHGTVKSSMSSSNKGNDKQQQKDNGDDGGDEEDDDDNDYNIDNETIADRMKKIKLILDEIYSDPLSEPFQFPVDVSQAPGYTEVVSKPMDLSIILKRANMSNSPYGRDPPTFLRDLWLIFRNCQAYNEENSSIYKQAKVLKSSIDKKFCEMFPKWVAVYKKQHGGRPFKKKIVVIIPDANTIEEDRDRDRASYPSLRIKKMKVYEEVEDDPKANLISEADAMIKLNKILSDIYSNTLSIPFQLPIDLSLAPGYTDIVKDPIDLSLIKQRLELSPERYTKNPRAFRRDMRLIFRNCQAYNKEESHIYKQSVILREFAEKRFSEEFAEYLNELKVLKAVGKRKQMEMEIEAYTPSTKIMRNNSMLDEDLIAAARASAAAGTSTSTGTGTGDQMAGASAATTVISSKVAPVLSPAEESAQLLALLNADEDCNSEPVRKSAFDTARSLRVKTKLPLLVDSIEVMDLGEIITGDEFHSAEVIYPVGYLCKRALHMRIVHKDDNGNDDDDSKDHSNINTDQHQYQDHSNESHHPKHRDVELLCEICEGNEDDYNDNNGENDNDNDYDNDHHHRHPLFRVSTCDGVIISEDRDPRSAMIEALNAGESILRVLGSKLRRCRAVLNRLCACGDSIPFLEEVPHAGGTEYYRQIKSPMWLREVRNKLVNGIYNNEFEFAWDVRLVFSNCMKFNLQGSELYDQAIEISELFENLFCQWVLNTIDVSIWDMAKGPWDQWSYLRYFDAENYGEQLPNMCCITGEIRSETELFFCEHCEDQYLPIALGMVANASVQPSRKKLWKCPRCTTCTYKDNNVPLPPKSYQREGVYIPANEIGAYWLKKSKSGRESKRTVYLSPLGMEIMGKDAALHQVSAEEETYKHLLDTREKEYKEYRANNKSIKGRKIDKNSSSSSNSTSKNNTENDRGVLTTGLLPYYTVPYDAKIVWYSVKYDVDEESKYGSISITRTALNMDNLSPSGFFGVDNVDIRGLIEGLDNSLGCQKYLYLEREKVREQLIYDITWEKIQKETLKTAKERLQDTIANERFRIQRENQNTVRRLAQRMSGSVLSGSGSGSTSMSAPTPPVTTSETSLLKGLLPLVPEGITATETEQLLSLWEFLSVARPLIGEIALSFSELSASIFPPSSIFPTVNQIVYDELACVLTGFLLSELRAEFIRDVFLVWKNAMTFHPKDTMMYSYARNLTLWFRSVLKRWDLTGMVYESSSSPQTQGQEQGQGQGQGHGQCSGYDVEFSHPASWYPEFTTNDTSNTSNNATNTASTSTKTSTFTSGSESDVSHSLSPVTIGHFIPQSYEESCSHSDLNRLETTLRLLTRIDSESWTKTERLQVLLTLMDQCISSQRFRTLIKQFYPEVDANTEPMDRVTDVPEKPIPIPIPSSSSSSPCAIATTTTSTKDLEIVHVGKGLRKSNIKCYFTGLEPQQVDSNETWAVVPEELLSDRPAEQIAFLSPQIQTQRQMVQGGGNSINTSTSVPDPSPETETTTITTGGNVRRTRAIKTSYTEYRTTSSRSRSRHRHQHRTTKEPVGGKVVAMVSAIRQILLARELALQEQQKLVERRLEIVSKLESSQLPMIESVSSERYRDLLRTRPLGYDRFNFEYWLLTAQQFMTLPSYSSKLKSDSKTDPAVLVHDPRTGHWSRHSGLAISSLINTFSNEIPCERALKEDLSQRYIHVLAMATAGPIKIKNSQEDMLKILKKCQKWLLNLSPSILTRSSNNPREVVKLLELVWARCVEVRLTAHYAVIRTSIPDLPDEKENAKYEREIYQKKKRIRDEHNEISIDFHPYMGWLRHDSFGRIRELGTSTTATRILSENTFLPFFSSLMRRSRLRTTDNIDMEDNVEDEDAVATAADHREYEEGDGVNVYVEHTGGTGLNRIKPIEQMDIETGEVLRRYGSGRAASRAMQVSQSGISQCCKGIKTDAYGFKWRFIDDSEISTLPPFQPRPIQELLKIRHGVRKDVRDTPIGGGGITSLTSMNGNDYDNDGNSNSNIERRSSGQFDTTTAGAMDVVMDADQDGDVDVDVDVDLSKRLKRKSIANVRLSDSHMSSSQSQSQGMGTGMGSVPRGRERDWPSRKKLLDVTLSTVLVNARLAKLKAELMNILLVLPPKVLRWPSLPCDIPPPFPSPILPSPSPLLSLPPQDVNSNNTNVTIPSYQNIMSSSSSSSPLAASTSITTPVAVSNTVPVPVTAPASGSGSSLLPTLWSTIGTTTTTTSTNVTVAAASTTNTANSSFLMPGTSSDLAQNSTNTTAASGVVPVPVTVSHSQQQQQQHHQQQQQQQQPPLIKSVVDNMRKIQIRQQNRQRSFEYFQKRLLEVQTSQELLELTLLLEEALPAYILPSYSKKSLPCTALCSSTVAMRIFALDRAIRYEDLKIENLNDAGRGRVPRTKYSPRCLLSSICTKAFCHTGRCSTNFEGFSRFSEVLDLTPNEKISIYGNNIINSNGISSGIGGGGGDGSGNVFRSMTGDGLSYSLPTGVEFNTELTHLKNLFGSGGVGITTAMSQNTFGLSNEYNKSITGNNSNLSSIEQRQQLLFYQQRLHQLQLNQQQQNLLPGTNITSSSTSLLLSNFNNNENQQYLENNGEYNVDLVQPYVPTAEEVSEMEWV
eukprot:gene2458-4777_t